MKAPNRQREVQLKFRVTRSERALIEQKMEQLGTTNMAAYLHKMAGDGYVVNLELPELREMVSLLRRSRNNLNQLTRRVHETGRFYDADLDELRQADFQLPMRQPDRGRGVSSVQAAVPRQDRAAARGR